MPVHRIRLIGPWEYEWRPKEQVPALEPVVASVKMPCDWQSLFGDTVGQAIFSRRFHRPTNLDPTERVFVVLTGVEGEGRIRVNGEDLTSFPASTSPVEIDVTDRLQPFNLLQVQLTHDPSQCAETRGGLYDAVVLEIRSD